MDNRFVLTLGLIFVLLGGLGVTIKINGERVEASATIYVRANGLVEGTDKIITADNVTYTFIDNINSPIVVERSNIVVDGNSYRLQGAGAGIGFTLNANGITIKNMVVTGFDVVGSGFASAIYSFSTANNAIVNDTITDNKWGVDLEWVSGYIISGNRIVSQSESGIYLKDSQNNVIYSNNITGNKNGITLVSSNNNKFYHNNFVNNVSPGFATDSDNNVWDDGYPSGGNHWSDYDGTDSNHDGIGDTSYHFDASNVDHYPLMNPYAIPEFSPILILTLFMIVTLLAVIVYRRRHVPS